MECLPETLSIDRQYLQLVELGRKGGEHFRLQEVTGLVASRNIAPGIVVKPLGAFVIGVKLIS